LELVIATKNPGKVREIRKALRGLRIRLHSLNDFPEIPDVEEGGKTFTENALKKARFYANYLKKITIADDSGLEVDALGGLPGIHSARYAGEGASNRENNRKLLKEMEDIPLSKRKARFRCVLALVSPDGRETIAEGVCQGRIGLREVGRRGFGYDPLFLLPQYGKTIAQLSIEEKNRISHRGKALRKLRKMLKTLMD
jgi:XTP/dITP diphosphohydrolase